MDVTPLIPAGRQLIEDYGGGQFRVSGVVFHGPVLVFPESAQAWDVGQFADLKPASFAPVVEAQPRPELLLVGTGRRMELLPRALRQELREAGIVVEWMDTGAACRTYNILLAEARRVAAALLPVG